jgi:hypothetical protein
MSPVRTADSPVEESGFEPSVPLEELAWDYLYDNHCGWENNDGAFGTFVFNVPDRTITLEHNERYTDCQLQQSSILREAAMAHPYHHSLSSVRKWGGSPFDYLPLHSWFDLM